MAAKKVKEEPELSDDPTSSEDEQLMQLRTTEEEKQGTIPGSEHATTMAMAGARAQANPMGRKPMKKVKRKKVKQGDSETETRKHDESQKKS